MQDETTFGLTKRVLHHLASNILLNKYFLINFFKNGTKAQVIRQKG